VNPQQKKKILDRLEKKGRINNDDLGRLRSEVNAELDETIDRKAKEMNELFIDIHISKLGIIS